MPHVNARPTTYHKLANRCGNCGHRKSMHGRGGCTVVAGFDIYKPIERRIPCRCRHLRNGRR